jgi:hypothetical protein
MARSKQMSVQKRQRERKKAEQAELKRAAAKRRAQDDERPAGGQVADRSDLEGYGVLPSSSEARDE